ncbi:MlaA family lipoprotein [Paraburkholderia sp. SOS3]|jgi:phospholipid-binding lipoprotein MlaA|uniref:MlaA family lipoprotein n=1 Tax=Paraburkholderia sp. SOS3 TaxID=1926494 RepID=UPI00094772A3|nr:VacJ family lipoprotein [Paraburkholderia sp. SOS3]APR38262.1 ABC transporter [Paraburkholderia sp. SOS3]
MKMRTAVLAMLATGLMSGCATGPNRTPGDPLEPMNRVIFNVNDKVDTAVAVPLAKGYQKVTPQPLRQAISNFFSNIGDLDNFANSMLQLHITEAVETLMRFTMNTVFGVGGLLDFATPAGLPKHKQDFGLTLGRWGMPSGPYLVLPLFGPSSFRDSVGFAVDFRFNPIHYLDWEPRTVLYGVQFLSVRSDLLGATSLLQQAALDKYSFVRDAYTQQRRALLRGTGAPEQALPDYGDEESGAAPAEPASGAAGSSSAPAGVPMYTDPGNAPAGGGNDGGPAVPNYSDPGDSSSSPQGKGTGTSGDKSGAPAVPNYSDPGESAPSSNAAPK